MSKTFNIQNLTMVVGAAVGGYLGATSQWGATGAAACAAVGAFVLSELRTRLA